MFISSLDNYEKRVMHSKSGNTEIMMNDEANKVIKELFDSLKNIYQANLESMKSSEFVFDYGWYIDSPDWIKNRKAAINPINKNIVNYKFEKNNWTIALNGFYAKKEKRYPAYVSKHNSNLENKLLF